MKTMPTAEGVVSDTALQNHFSGNSRTNARVPVRANRRTSECHRHLIRTGLSARVAYFVGVGGMAMAAG
jgi:hypothetical protein